MEFFRLPEQHVEILLRPVTIEEYIQVIRKDVPRLGRKREAGFPITDVSASEARDFATRIGGRLPKLTEIEILTNLFPFIFSYSIQRELWEWLDCTPEWARDRTPNNCIVGPSLLQYQNGGKPRGSIPDRRMSFVTFRIVRV